MEEIYIHLTERLTSVDTLIKKTETITSQLETNPSLSASPQQLAELSIFMNNLKKAEKMRLLKENDYLEVVFGFRNFDSAQRLRFQTKSYETMQKIASDFSYDNYNPSGEIKDICKVYLKFFQHLQLAARVEDLKRAYANNKLINYPMISILAKWLVEISRQHYQDIIKQKSAVLYSKMSFQPPHVVAKKPMFNENTQRAIRQAKASNSVEPLTDRTIEKDPQQTLRVKLRELSDEISKKNFPKIASAPVSNTNGAIMQKAIAQIETKQTLSSLIFKEKNETPAVLGQKLTNKPEEAKKESEKETTGIKSRSESVDQLSPEKPKAITSRQRVAEPLVEESYPKLVTVRIPDQTPGNYLDVIEDLDFTSSSYILPAGCFKPYAFKKSKGTKMLDFEKKKDLMVQLYKNLYARNIEIDRTISNYRRKRKPLNDQAQAAARGGDSYLETLSVTWLLKRFGHLISEQVKQMYPHIFPSAERTSLAAISQLRFRIKTNNQRESRSLPPERAVGEAQDENSNRLAALAKEPENTSRVVNYINEAPLESERKSIEEPCERENPFSDRLFHMQRDDSQGYAPLSDRSRYGQRDELNIRGSMMSSQILEKRFSTPDLTKSIGKFSDCHSVQQPQQLSSYSAIRVSNNTFYDTPLRNRGLKLKEYLPHVTSSGNLQQIKEAKDFFTEGVAVTFYHNKDTKENKFATTLREKERVQVPPLKFQEQLNEISLFKKMVTDPSNTTLEGFKGSLIKAKQPITATELRKSHQKTESPLVKKTLLTTSTKGAFKSPRSYL